MTNFIKYISAVALAITLIGCQSDSSKQNQTAQQSQQPPQGQGQMGQLQQQPTPDIDLSDEEAATFADAAMAAQKIQMSSQKEMVGIIQDEGLDIETYKKIAQSQMGQGAQGASNASNLDVSESDMQNYESATKALQKAQENIREDVTSAIEGTGMEMERYREIGRAAQQDSALQMQIQQQIQQRMGAQMRQQMPQRQSTQGN